MRRRSTALLVAVLAAALTPLSSPAPAVAAPAPVTLSSTTATAAPDFATDAYADPWDFANRADLSPDVTYVGNGASRARYANGEYDVTMARGGWLDFVRAIDGSLAYGRDGRTSSINADVYTRMSVRMFSSVATTALVYWFRCNDATASCQGATQLPVHPGWGTYDIAMQNTTGTAAPWSGTVTGFRFYPAATADAQIGIDHLRLYRPAAAGAVTVRRSGGSGPGQLVLDPAAGRAAGTQSVLLRDGRPVPVPANGTATLDTSMLPAGSWSVGVQDSTGAIAYGTDPVVVAAPPAPVVLDPDLGGGTDYTEVARGGDRWDFSQPSDVSGTSFVANGRTANGVFSGTNADPQPNENEVRLPVPVPIDGSRFHRLTFTASYDGPFGLDGAPGGGMLARLIWSTAGAPGKYQDLNDVVVVPGKNTVTLDLATTPPGAITDEGTSPRIGWAGQQITSLRFDPNEDPGTRSWSIDDIRIAQDDAGTGTFPVHFQDAAWAPGTTADVYVDTNSSGLDGSAVATGVPVTAGVNTVALNLGSRPAGSYWVYTTLHRGGASTSAYSTGPVQMTPSVPVGGLDAAAQGPGGIRVAGWAADPQGPGSSTEVRAYVDGRYSASVAANRARPDVDAATGLGPDHGFDAVLPPAPVGNHQVCVYAIGQGGPNSTIGCRTVTVTATPVGNLEAASPVTGGLLVQGWSVDPDTADATRVHVYVDGRFAAQAVADGARPDVAAGRPGYGAAHGYAVRVPAAPGLHQVCAYAINQAGGGSNATLGCRTVTVSGTPFGAVDRATRSGGTVRVQGWALDPVRAAGTQVHVYVDGVGRGILDVTGARPDVAAAYPGYASATLGYDGTVPLPAGARQVCVYAVGASAALLLACQNG